MMMMNNDKLYDKNKKHGVLQPKRESSLGWGTYISLKLHQQKDHLASF